MHKTRHSSPAPIRASPQHEGRAWREVQLPFGFDAVLSLAFAGLTLFRQPAQENVWTNALSPSFTGREISAVFTPQEAPWSQKALIGFVAAVSK